MARFGTRLQELVGYSVYAGLMGHIDRHDPVELLAQAAPDGPEQIAPAPPRGRPIVWDRI